MRSAACVGNCLFSSLWNLIGEHYGMIIAGGIVGGLLGLVSGASFGILTGAVAGLVIATVYGYVPRLSDCAGECRIR